MAEMTSHERYRRMLNHEQADRIPVIDKPWGATIERWHAEGLPEDVPFWQYFDLDPVPGISADNSPQFEETVIEETDDYIIHTTRWGVTEKQWKHAASTPQFLDFTIVDPDSWQKAKARMTPSRDRVDWDALQTNYAQWKEQDLWISADLWFGFDVTHSWAVGTERLLMALVEDPEWCKDMFGHYLDVHLALFEMIWEEGYTFDAVRWPDDMGYKLSQFFSLEMYREILKPFHKKAADWAHARGVKVHLHSCGDIRPFIPDLIDLGIDCLNPLEVKAGCDPVAIKQQYGQELCLHGGINAVLWDDFEKISQEMRRVLPEMKQGGGYIFSSDHSVPSSVSLETFGQIVHLAKELGSYE